MDQPPSRFCFDNSGNTDYSDLHRWSPHLHSGYKSPAPNDNSSYIYTSDYGSYSSQESNHSGTTYSNLADCEEALNSPNAVAYDLPPPEMYNSMERRRDKPLPPPRMTSRTQAPNSQRVQPPVTPVRQKKISFDDSSMTKVTDKGDSSSIPSFATLPRKKKLVNSNSTNSMPAASVQSSTQVTWMKEVAQKGESMTKSKSTGTIDPNKKPQGILKNKLPAGKTHSDTNGYIKRDTVQKILDQQRKAINRQSAAPNQFYKSMPTLRPSPPVEHSQPSLQKAWEYNYMDNSQFNTATVIGVFEPSMGGNSRNVNHHKQGSDETEFEFPPPPSDHDIAQIMSEKELSNHQKTKSIQSNSSDHSSTQHSQEPIRGRSRAPSSRPSLNRSQSQNEKDRKQKPQVPQRPPKPVSNGHVSKVAEDINRNNSLPKPNVRPRGKSVDRMSTERRKVHTDQRAITQKFVDNNYNQIVPPPRLPKPQKFFLQKFQKSQRPSSPVHQNSSNVVGNSQDFGTDIVLPPPAEFMGSTTHLATSQPSYGDYELLSPEAQYEKCDIHPTMSRQSMPESNYVYNQSAQRHVMNGGHNTSTYTPRASYQQRMPDAQADLNTYHVNPGYARTLINHSHQYSTEL